MYAIYVCSLSQSPRVYCRKWALCWVLVIFLFINNAATGQDNRTPVGKVTQVQGTVSASFQETLRPLQTGDPVFFKDQLRTGPGARLAVILNDDAKLTLGPVSNLTIDEYIYTPQGESPSMKLKLLNGLKWEEA